MLLWKAGDPINKNDTSLLILRKYYTIQSTETGRIYMDQELRCYLFDSEREANQFCESVPGTCFKKDSANYIKQLPFLSFCYGLGIQGIRLKATQMDNFHDIPVESADTKLQFYNPVAFSNVLRLKQTKKGKYLKALSDAFFLSPVLIMPRAEGEYPFIRYAYAQFPGNGIYYLLFTTIQEFNKWNDTQKTPCKPHQSNLQDLNRVRGDASVLINAMSDRLVLTDKQIRSITKPEQHG